MRFVFTTCSVVLFSITRAWTTSTAVDSKYSNNEPEPSPVIYPQKHLDDVPFSVDETLLRSSIYIPSGFEYGQGNKTPILLVPGTGISGGSTYTNTIGKLLQGTTYADPVWLNIPGNSLGDIQMNSEYVAYAINYVSAISGNCNISIISWSQGAINVHWSFMYWPSTRQAISDFVALSPDFKGTVLASFLCSRLTPPALCVPSIIQQESSSNFMSLFSSNGGREAFVPTTTVYSSTDEIVQPQDGANASGYIDDPKAVGVSNNQIQALCPGIQVVLHEGILYNAVAWALIQDAITHPGPGQSSRLKNLKELCYQIYAPGLFVVDVVGSESLLIQALTNVALYTPKTTSEPEKASYVI
ncbi:hypothetical protein BJY01DRAFT_217081 [Aspergillus pseudoustus]|uniref:Alpha/Beta hydrolase protein n=1 Tax=Aspergillus pseudoustus TaxID=1810923 RepID=A0ABR4JPV3_9EURO